VRHDWWGCLCLYGYVQGWGEAAWGDDTCHSLIGWGRRTNRGLIVPGGLELGGRWVRTRFDDCWVWFQSCVCNDIDNDINQPFCGIIELLNLHL